MGDNTKQVRVDNWGNFFLQRLQMFFSKTDYCDMTLQFEGNVQLKVHRLVMNACTEYFQFLEQTCTLEDNVIMMPSDLQADVIVPIVNFMYTGMLEFHLTIFEKLYKTAQIMNITILTKLLDAQKHPYSLKSKRKLVEAPRKPPTPKPELPAPLPGRKLPVWKRKNAPSTSTPGRVYTEQKYNTTLDPLSLQDNAPKPTRFEWPDEEMPPLNLMDTSFEDISYTSRPLLTQEEENRASTSFDDLRHLPNTNRVITTTKKEVSPTIDMEEMKNYVKEQKIRSGLSQDDQGLDNEMESTPGKRKASTVVKTISKKVRFDENDKGGPTISIATDGKAASDLNHEKIVTEILKKYPQLVKKNKNIRLKIMAKKEEVLPAPKKVAEVQKIDTPRSVFRENKGPWTCHHCSKDDGEPLEFILYYLYRKHMTDIHNEKFDLNLCKYCGHRATNAKLLMYHLYTKHGLKPTSGNNFPKCNLCPHIALSQTHLTRHLQRHNKNEIQCVDCKLTFTSQATLTNHIQITGHTGKAKGSHFDCQYCTKRLPSCMNLFNHLRSQHRNEAIRDGIVSIDESDDDFDEEEEYILPELITPPVKKVNVLSNVKVRELNNSQQLALEPSSEAEALNNVATGIATSLGLVDIVVLNENQQLFLQQDQTSFTAAQNEQPEYILPELNEQETFVQEQTETITTDGVMTDSILSTGELTSTDELVMVLTDHDYGDNQEEINNENSNIVVLYSHPVDGQQEQFITSQGNIMVNSQTGMIEIRNGATITTTANQVVMNQPETHIESIEMIQREIENPTDVKPTAIYHDEIKEQPNSDTQPQNSEVQIPVETLRQSESLIESLEQGEQLEFTAMPMVEEQAMDVENVACAEQELPTNTEDVDASSKQEIIESNVPDETNSIENEKTLITEVEDQPEPIDTPQQIDTDQQDVEHNTDDCTPIEENSQQTDETESEAPQTLSISEEPNIPISEELDVLPVSEEIDLKQPSKTTEKYQLKENESTETIPIDQTNEVVNNTTSEDSLPILPINEEPIQPSTDIDQVDVTVPSEAVIEEENKTNEPVELVQSDSSTSQFNDDNSQSSQESQKGSNSESVSTKIAILDDWEDTDSQQSNEHNKEEKEKDKEKDKVAKTVNKLIDDWADDEEDESRKEG